jgi:hypothetical protein
MKKYIVPVIISFFLTLSYAGAQTMDANISFEKGQHNFGKIKEADGSVTYNFEFTNTGSKPLIISQVRASCGCTSPNWSREPVLPGNKGFVSATYNPKNRPGPFNKSITVISNATTPNKVLRILGDVIPKPQGIEDIYRYSMGKIRLKSNHMSFARVVKGQMSTQVMEIINVSNEPVSITFNRIPSHITISANPTTLKPNETGMIEATYDSESKGDWGFVFDRVNILLNGESGNANRLTISATIEEDFSKLTPEQLANAPTISFDNHTFQFNEIKQGEKVEHTYTITNNGKSDLIIRKVKASCGCTAVSPVDDIVKAGESTTMKVIFNSAGKMGKQNKTITVISNDPKHSRTVLWVKGNVVK